MTGLSEFFNELFAWCGNNYLLLSAVQVGSGFLSAFAFGYLCFRAFERFVAGGFDPLSSGHFALFFANALWGFFLPLLSGTLQQYSMGPAFQVVLIIWISFAPISLLAGIPALLVYLFKRPVLQPRTIYITAASIFILAYVYAALINRAFDGSS